MSNVFPLYEQRWGTGDNLVCKARRRFLAEPWRYNIFNYYVILYVLPGTMFLFCYVLCPSMAINVVVSVQHNGGFLPDITLLTQWYYHRGTHLNAMVRGFVFAAYDPT